MVGFYHFYHILAAGKKQRAIRPNFQLPRSDRGISSSILFGRGREVAARGSLKIFVGFLTPRSEKERTVSGGGGRPVSYRYAGGRYFRKYPRPFPFNSPLSTGQVGDIPFNLPLLLFVRGRGDDRWRNREAIGGGGVGRECRGVGGGIVHQSPKIPPPPMLVATSPEVRKNLFFFVEAT